MARAFDGLARVRVKAIRLLPPQPGVGLAEIAIAGFGRTGLGCEIEVAGQEGLVEDDLALALLAKHGGLHAVVENLVRHNAKTFRSSAPSMSPVGQLETFPALSRMSVPGGKADEIRAKADIPHKLCA